MTDHPITDDFALDVQHSLGGRAWRLRPCDERLAVHLSQQFELEDMVGRVLAGRGVTPEDAPVFLSPSLRSSLPDPSVLKDMDVAADRIAAAIAGGEQLAVFGDYDVDGATSSALLKKFMDAVGGRLRIYIPDRITEGYGPNSTALAQLASEGVGLVITVDCGTLSYEPLAAAAKMGLEVIVVDHHKAESELPTALAVVNPNRLDEDGNLGQLAAVGVTFLLVVAVNRALRRAGWYTADRLEPDLLAWLDVVALGTVCDVVPLTGPNRALVAQGLKVMARRDNIGLAALADVARMDAAPAVYHLGFLLGPRVNAGGRVGEADLGARLLTTHDPALARSLAEQLDLYNSERQALEADVQAQALASVLSEKNGEDPHPVVFASGEGWHPGVIGIVASRLTDRFGRPSVVIAIDEAGDAKGSARSIPGVDIGAAIIEAARRGHITKGGGHAMAAGLSARADQLPALRAFLEEWLEARVEKARAGRVLDLDGVLSLKGCTLDLVKALEALAPFGMGNPAPRFALPSVELVRCDMVGRGHVRCIFAGSGGGRLKAVAFRVADQELGEALLKGIGKRFHVAGRLKIDDWGAKPRVEMTIDDAVLA
ncbi:single-stranded-DNA-specific exonuclease RecJ [Iodidimonas muriae]|uniref:Single-stranded-DNA-specific exonuclease RecJ n=1 Tax=Iodidimonas muriae TaxID=261467 RepID=A0ABQ2LE15_9PROT|nr:single-stranded-DNA-specific exonuclease RecJ [Iodidimonas muriae]GER07122.1 single-stranded-DNA-specific exonuclease RecJ [Kordiimonadales bacterium JCM 17843]GGO12918.1 single-stranded-DNA-specific exonuclease RecJ [Iodidimonas muriae]